MRVIYVKLPHLLQGSLYECHRVSHKPAVTFLIAPRQKIFRLKLAAHSAAGPSAELSRRRVHDRGVGGSSSVVAWAEAPRPSIATWPEAPRRWRRSFGIPSGSAPGSAPASLGCLNPVAVDSVEAALVTPLPLDVRLDVAVGSLGSLCRLDGSVALLGRTPRWILWKKPVRS